MKYRKKPVVVEAIQWTGKNLDEVRVFCPEAQFGGELPGDICIEDEEGDTYVGVGEWIIKNADGMFDSYQPDIFAATYEAVPPDNCCGAIGCPGGITLYCGHASYLAGQMTTTTRDGRVYLQTTDQGFKCALGRDTAWVARDGCGDFEKREGTP